jgi:hypothetical protein
MKPTVFVIVDSALTGLLLRSSREVMLGGLHKIAAGLLVQRGPVRVLQVGLAPFALEVRRHEGLAPRGSISLLLFDLGVQLGYLGQVSVGNHALEDHHGRLFEKVSVLVDTVAVQGRNVSLNKIKHWKQPKLF